MAKRVENTLLVALYAFTGLALAGFASFGLNPSLLGKVPGVAGFYGVSFRFFAQGHIVLAWLVLAVGLTRVAGWRWVGGFAVLYAISLASELAGTRYGVPFGSYAYTDYLGYKWLGHVPAVIPLSWFCMAVASYTLATAGLGGKGRGGAVGRVLFGSLILGCWDLALDPAMSELTPYWVWGATGPYYGMPWLNLFGWYLTGVVLMSALEAMHAERWLSGVGVRWFAWYYAALLLLPLGMVAAAGLWGAVAATLAALLACGSVAWLAGTRRDPGRRGVAEIEAG